MRNNKIKTECRKVVNTRLQLAHVELRAVYNMLAKDFNMMDKVISSEKLRMALVTGKREMCRIGNLNRNVIIEQQNAQFSKR